MSFHFIIVLLFVVSYLLGSIPTAYLVSRFMFGQDIRQHGSHNVGGANAFRLYGKKAFLIVGIVDVFKGTFSIIITKSIMSNSTITYGVFANIHNVLALCGFFAVLGHCFSLYLKFAGGKGGGTTFGILIALHPLIALYIFIFWMAIVTTTRFTSLGNLLTLPFVAILLQIMMPDPAYYWLGIMLTILIYFKHRENISRLINGIERKWGEKEITI